MVSLDKAGATTGATGVAGRALVVPARAAAGGAAEDPVEATTATIVFAGGMEEELAVKARGEP